MGKKLSEYCEDNAVIIGYLECLEKRLKKSRFKHTCGVVETACQLAKHYGIDPVKTMAAAALHDYAKNLNSDELLSYAEAHGLPVDAAMKESAELLHGAVGAIMVKNELGIDDSEILSAIAYHTVGRTGMGMIEKIVYIADAIEPGRTEYPGLQELRALVYEDLDQSILISVTSTIRYVMDRGIVIHPNSVALYNELISTTGKPVFSVE